MNEELILAKILTISLDLKKITTFINKVNNLDLQDTVIGYFRQYLDDEFRELSEEAISRIGNKVKYNLITRFISKAHDNDSYSALKYQNSMLRNRFLGVIQEWEHHPQLGKSFAQTLLQLGGDVRPEKIVSWYGIEHDYGFYSDELLSSIASLLIDEISKKPVHMAKTIQPLLQKEMDELQTELTPLVKDFEARAKAGCPEDCRVAQRGG